MQKPFQSRFLQVSLTGGGKVLLHYLNRKAGSKKLTDLLCSLSGSGCLAIGWATLGTFILGWICWETCLDCSARLLFWLWGSTFWLECCVDLTAEQTSVSDLWWLTGRWMRWGPFDTPNTRCCGVGVTTARWDCCDTGILLGPSPLDWNFKKADKHTHLLKKIWKTMRLKC